MSSTAWHTRRDVDRDVVDKKRSLSNASGIAASAWSARPVVANQLRQSYAVLRNWILFRAQAPSSSLKLSLQPGARNEVVARVVRRSPRSVPHGPYSWRASAPPTGRQQAELHRVGSVVVAVQTSTKHVGQIFTVESWPADRDADGVGPPEQTCAVLSAVSATRLTHPKTIN